MAVKTMADTINKEEIKINGHEFTIDDIKKANAGNRFNSGEWVKAWENADGDNYEDVRNGDEILQVLQSHKNMDFTHTQTQNNVDIEKYLRLLMPKYIRRVEVEDLNRNFWVLGQTISAISSYLFDKTTKDIHTEVVYLNNFVDYPDYYNMKFDNFAEGTTTWNIGTENSILDRLEHFKKLYPKTILIIVPIIRRDNYKYNYYSTELYPGIAIYNPNHLSNDNNGWKIIKFTDGDNKTGLITLSSDSEITNQLLGTNTDDEKNIYYGSYKQIKDGTLKEKSNESSKYYKACLRTIPHITYHLDSNNKVIIDEFIITLQDAAWRAAITTRENNIGALSAENFNENTDFKALTRSLITRTFSRTNIGITGQKIGFYLGEVLSTKSVQSTIEEITQKYNITINNIDLEPIVSLYEICNKTSKITEAKSLLFKVVSSDSNMKQVLGSDIDLEKVRLLLGTRKASLYETSGNCTLQNYWQLNNSNLEKITIDNDHKYQNRYNAAQETAYTGGAVYFPNSNYKKSFDYEFIANPFPVVHYGGFDDSPTTHDGYTVGGKVVQDNPDEWQGGRAMASYISASAIQNKRLANERHGNIFYYYTVMTKNGEPITDPNSEWAVIYTQIYVCYGLLPYFYPEIDTSKGMFYFKDGYIYETTNGSNYTDSPYHDIKPNPILPRTGISTEGNQTGSISGYNDDYKQNTSFFVSNYQRGWNIPSDIMIKIIQYMRNNSISTDKNIVVNFKNTYSNESPWGTIGNVNNNQIIAQTINRAGPKNCILDTTKTIMVPKEFNQIEVDNNGNIINIHNFIADEDMGSDIFLGSVIKVTTHIFKNDGSSSRKEWSMYDYRNQNFEISLTKPTNLSNSVKALRNENYDVMYVGGNIPGCSNLFEVWKNYSGTETGYKRYIKMLNNHSMPDFEQYPLNGNTK